jgi:hypothetical protein
MDGRERDAERDAQTAAAGRRQPAAPEPERPPLLKLAAAVGNAAIARLARDGAGLLPGGRVHPDVEQAIAARRGGGRSLDADVRDRMAEHLDEPLHDVRVHADADAANLARSVSARAFTTGADVYFAQGEYRPGSPAGDELIAHELAHVKQQRGAPTSGPLTVSDPGDSLEQEAEATARDLGHQ